ncbi:MAG: CRISPR-associated helicase Cas3' [Epsilonproteobacteria bacterium]|nr:CRISPR-associated helicase Cas3' [Campylobacterota bacterium]
MVSDISKYKSHPDKRLPVHIEGVLKKVKKRTSLKIAEVAAIFHDLGKINPNFQRKLETGSDYDNQGYDEHSYLSVYSFLCYGKSNPIQFKELLNGDFSKLWSLVALISHHHGNLPDFNKGILKETPKRSLEKFLKTNPYLPFSHFLNDEIKFKNNGFSLDESISIFETINFNKGEWSKNALTNFIQTQFAFACLVEADKRDAADMSGYYFDLNIENSVNGLLDSLTETFRKFKSETSLNKLRTDIRLEAVTGITEALRNGKRVFELTAPTGAGKTYTLLALANEIQQQKENLGIIYALPFLSITEQVQGIANKLLKNILPVSSKSYNERLEKAQELFETEQTNENLKELLKEDFIQQTFDHPFIITTFVQLFETLVSNRNSTLLKLPNFANRIFLIDEIQALPPKLYIFFTAWLDEFCRLNNSYAILSTATMPDFELINKGELLNYANPIKLFQNYQKPIPILKPDKFFSQDVFNRYQITIIKDDNFVISALTNHILEQDQSCLVILNTIDDTKQLNENLKEFENCILLNTHFIPDDRSKKIETAKQLLDKNEKVILISTQLIEAGVDIDFPIVYRDLCPLPSLIQSAGRCNRNKTKPFGQVWFFELVKESGKRSAELIYRDEAKQFLNFVKQEISTTIQEKDLYNIQKKFFSFISTNLTIGENETKEGKMNMIECVNNAEFETLGKFQLIPENNFGKQYQYYVRQDYGDNSYDELLGLMFDAIDNDNFEKRKKSKIAINLKIKEMSNRILQVRVYNDKDAPNFENINKEYFNIRVLSDLDDYNFETGLEIKGFSML